MGETPRSDECGCRSPAKWEALVNDQPVPLPHRNVKVSVIKAQANVPDDQVLVRDHNSPDDVVLPDDGIADLAEGNVFYTLAACDVQPRPVCSAPAKLAFFVDDRPEVTIRRAQTGKTLRELFCVQANVRMTRDKEGSNDTGIRDEDAVNFEDGPVFYTRTGVSTLKIIVNKRNFTERDGVKPVMTGKEIAALVFPENPDKTTIWIETGERREIALEKPFTIHNCDEFCVVRKEVTGGFEPSRIQREVGLLQTSGQEVTLVESPIAAVVFHEMKTRPGYAISSSDVLVLIPSSYPGQMLDGAYLPVGSPLIGKVKGKPQGNHVSALGRTWQLISYHPHNGGGGPSWNSGIHGIHTYFGEIASWLCDAQ